MLYQWKNARIGGGGLVAGIVIHPTTQDKIYARTTHGGVYSYSPAPDSLDRNWAPLLDGFDADEENYFGVESIAVDPHDATGLSIIAALGKSSATGLGRLFRSTNGGNTWAACNLQLAMDAGNREGLNWTTTGERLAYDPNTSGVVYYGARDGNIYRSTNSGVDWTLCSVPAGSTSGGVTDIKVSSSGIPYAAIQGVGICRALDGVNFSLLGGLGATNPRQIAIVTDSLIYVAFGDTVRKWNGSAWSASTPASAAFLAIAVDPTNSSFVIVSEAVTGSLASRFWISTNGASSWTEFSFTNSKLSAGTVSGLWSSGQEITSFAAVIALDPNVSGRAFLGNWAGIVEVADFRASVLALTPKVKGLSVSHAYALLPLPASAGSTKLLSGHRDLGLFGHEDLNSFAERKTIGSSVFPSSVFFTQDGLLYSPAGTEFTYKSANLFPGATPTGVLDSMFNVWHFNAGRVAYVISGGSPVFTTGQFESSCADVMNRGKPVLGNYHQVGGYPSDANVLAAWHVARFNVFKGTALEKYYIPYIFSEPGGLSDNTNPGSGWTFSTNVSVTWFNMIVTVVTALRAAGCMGAIVAVAPNLGQDILINSSYQQQWQAIALRSAIIKYGPSILASVPLVDGSPNLVFGVHVYENYASPGNTQGLIYFNEFIDTAKSLDIPIIASEYGVQNATSTIVGTRVLRDSYQSGRKCGRSLWAFDSADSNDLTYGTQGNGSAVTLDGFGNPTNLTEFGTIAWADNHS